MQQLRQKKINRLLNEMVNANLHFRDRYTRLTPLLVVAVTQEAKFHTFFCYTLDTIKFRYFKLLRRQAKILTDVPFHLYELTARK
jgi:predicted GTPase